MQAARDSFHDSSAAHLPGSVIENLPVRQLLLPLCFFRCSLPGTATCHSPRSARQRSSCRYKASALKCVISCSQADTWCAAAAGRTAPSIYSQVMGLREAGMSARRDGRSVFRITLLCCKMV
jgi:hypothetical protein